MALNAVQNQPLVPQITNAGGVVTGISVGANAGAGGSGSSSTNDLLNTVLFRNCTPEEAVSSTGLPVATVRQQLRQAMQQLRTPGVS